VFGEISQAEPILDEAVPRRRIGYAEQRFGDHHKGEALIGGERKLAQQLIDAAEARRRAAHARDDPSRLARNRIQFAA